jgi:threonine/homoserine/homoserine lactone efflux protein
VIRQSFWIGLGLAVANPFGPAFWLTVSGSIGQQSQVHAVTFLSGFVLGTLLSSLLIALLAGQWRARLTPRIIRLALSACGLILIAFGLGLGYTTISA